MRGAPRCSFARTRFVRLRTKWLQYFDRFAAKGLAHCRSRPTVGEPLGMRVSCFECALRARGLFKPVTPTELSSINNIKRDHLTLPSGSEIIHANEDSPVLYTLYSGWAFRFKTLPDGRRQILNFLLPAIYSGCRRRCSTPRSTELRL